MLAKHIIPCLDVDKGRVVKGIKFVSLRDAGDPADKAVVAGQTTYGISFASMLWRGNMFATQFHPEKSQTVGLKLLENFVKL